MSTRPEKGENVIMPFMGDDVYIEVSEVPEVQPLVDLEGLYIFVDQYGETQLAERDGADQWIAVNPSDLTPAGYDIWEEYLSDSGIRMGLN